MKTFIAAAAVLATTALAAPTMAQGYGYGGSYGYAGYGGGHGGGVGYAGGHAGYGYDQPRDYRWSDGYARGLDLDYGRRDRGWDDRRYDDRGWDDRGYDGHGRADRRYDHDRDGGYWNDGYAYDRGGRYGYSPGYGPRVVGRSYYSDERYSSSIRYGRPYVVGTYGYTSGGYGGGYVSCGQSAPWVTTYDCCCGDSRHRHYGW